MLGAALLLGQPTAVLATDPGTGTGTIVQVNVRDAQYGAIGDGLTDDTNAIQKAVTAANGGVLVIPDGVYIISQAITLPKNLTITGTGTLKKSNDFTQSTINPAGMMLDGRYSNIEKLHITGITIDGNEAEQPTFASSGMYSVGVTVYHAKNIFVEGVTFKNTGYRAFDLRWTDTITFNKNTFEDCGVNIAGIGLDQMGDNVNDTNGGNALSYDVSTNIKVTNNIFKRWGDAATDGEEATDVLIDNNKFYGMSYKEENQTVRWTPHPEESAISMSGQSRVTVTNNEVYSLRGVTGFVPTKSISGKKVALRDITIKNNNITGAALAGIDLWGVHADLPSANILIQDNTIKMEGGRTVDRYTGAQSDLKEATGAITFHQYMQNLDVINNTIDANGSVFTSDLPGVMFHGASNDTVTRIYDVNVENNTITNARGAGVYVRNAQDVTIKGNDTYNNGLAYSGQSYRGDVYLLRVNRATVTENELRPHKEHLNVGIFFNLTTNWTESLNQAFDGYTEQPLWKIWNENTVE